MNYFKGVLGKVVAPALIVGSLMMPISSRGEDNLKKEFVPENNISAKTGFYFDESDAIKNRYGALFSTGFFVNRGFNKNFKGDFGVNLSFANKNKGGEESNLFLITFSGVFQLFFDDISKQNQSTFFYSSAGIIYDNIREKITSRGIDGISTYSGSSQGIGITIGGGLEYVINPDKNKRSKFADSIFFEVLYESVSTERLDRSGIRLNVGAKTRLFN